MRATPPAFGGSPRATPPASRVPPRLKAGHPASQAPYAHALRSVPDGTVRPPIFTRWRSQKPGTPAATLGLRPRPLRGCEPGCPAFGRGWRGFAPTACAAATRCARRRRPLQRRLPHQAAAWTGGFAPRPCGSSPRLAALANGAAALRVGPPPAPTRWSSRLRPAACCALAAPASPRRWRRRSRCRCCIYVPYIRWLYPTDNQIFRQREWSFVKEDVMPAVLRFQMEHFISTSQAFNHVRVYFRASIKVGPVCCNPLSFELW